MSFYVLHIFFALEGEVRDRRMRRNVGCICNNFKIFLNEKCSSKAVFILTKTCSVDLNLHKRECTLIIKSESACKAITITAVRTIIQSFSCIELIKHPLKYYKYLLQFY